METFFVLLAASARRSSTSVSKPKAPPPPAATQQNLDSTPKSRPRTTTSPPRVVAPAIKSPSQNTTSLPMAWSSGNASMPIGFTLSAADVCRQKELELKKNDETWQERMSQLEESLQKTNDVMEKEYSTAVDDVRKRFASAPPTHQLPPCQELKAKVIACYRAHPGETLLCAEPVAFFRNCVNLHRIQKLDIETMKKTTSVEKK